MEGYGFTKDDITKVSNSLNDAINNKYVYSMSFIHYYNDAYNVLIDNTEKAKSADQMVGYLDVFIKSIDKVKGLKGPSSKQSIELKIDKKLDELKALMGKYKAEVYSDSVDHLSKEEAKLGKELSVLLKEYGFYKDQYESVVIEDGAQSV
jgi:hypothetical protein